MLNNMSFYFLVSKLKFKSMKSYRNAFFISSISLVIFNLIGFLLVWIMISSFGEIGSWKPFEVIFLYALNLGAFAIASCFFQSASYNLPIMIQNGDFDQVLTKPINSFVYFFSSYFGFNQLPHLLLAIGVLILSCIQMNFVFSLSNIVKLFIVILSGAVIQGAIYIISAIPSFWFIQNNSMTQIALSFRSFIRFPISAYHQPVQFLLTFIIPYAFINFYPSQLFLDKKEYLMFGEVIIWLSPVVATFWMILAIVLWNFGIKNYKSTGS